MLYRLDKAITELGQGSFYCFRCQEDLDEPNCHVCEISCKTLEGHCAFSDCFRKPNYKNTLDCHTEEGEYLFYGYLCDECEQDATRSKP